MNDKIRILKIKPTADGSMLTISGTDAPLPVSRETVYNNRLIEGIVLTQSQLDKLQAESELYRCNHEVARLLAMRDHTIGEVKVKLRRKKFTATVIEAAIKKYREMGALDDARVAHGMAQSLLERRPCGRAYLSAYLQKKKIDRLLAEQTVDLLVSDQDHIKQAIAALEKRWSRFSRFELETARSKAYNYLARRGFSYSDARTAFEQLLDKEQEEPHN
ncbi:MAG: regulatory protein RecX [candidate division Zixibacteria bacterium]|nr:regulatory protein RecX [candidate division Zixibacteria bacterium]